LSGNGDKLRRPPADRGVREGDIMVTRVGDIFAIGRLKADCGSQEPLGTDRTRAGALQRACTLAGQNHRVFLCAQAGPSTYLPCDCAEVLARACHQTTATARQPIPVRRQD